MPKTCATCARKVVGPDSQTISMRTATARCAEQESAVPTEVEQWRDQVCIEIADDIAGQLRNQQKPENDVKEINIDVARKVLQTIDAGLSHGMGKPEPGKMCV